MKKTLTLLALLAVGTVVSFAQGVIDVSTVGESAYFITTNNMSGANPGNATEGNVAGLNQYYFALLYTTSATAPADNPLANGWTVASGFTITNYSLDVGVIRGTGGATGTAVTGIPSNPGPAYSNGTTFYYMLIGWSSVFGGPTAATTILADDSASSWGGSGYFGYSAVGENVSGNPSAELNSVSLFGDTSSIPGYGLTSGFQLDPVVVPEPTSMVLAGLGGLGLLALRRKK